MIRETFSALSRGAAMRALYDKGHATSQQILEIEYGVWPPKGVNHTDDNKLDTDVQLKPFYKDKSSGIMGKVFTGLMALGYVHGKQTAVGSELKKAPIDQTIYMNPFLLDAPGRVLGALSAYNIGTSLAASVSSAGVIAGIGSFMYSHAFLSTTALVTSLGLLPFLQMATLPLRSFSDVVGHEHIHLLQIHDAKRAATGYAMDEDNFKDVITERHDSYTGLKKVSKVADNLFSLGMSRYFLNDVEVQARMHTLMVHGYHRWGRLPETPMELKAALIDSGLNAPKSVREEVSASQEDGVKDFLKPGLSGAFGRAARRVLFMDAVELNVSQRAMVDSDLKVSFWNRTTPFMYGHLLELYGDEGGLKKMGFDRDDPLFTPRVKKKKWYELSEEEFEDLIESKLSGKKKRKEAPSGVEDEDDVDMGPWGPRPPQQAGAQSLAL